MWTFLKLFHESFSKLEQGVNFSFNGIGNITCQGVLLGGTSLTKAVDMGHTWSKYGNGMGQPMTNVWVLYGFYMGH